MKKVFAIILLPLFQYCYTVKDGVPVFVIQDGKAPPDKWNVTSDFFLKTISSTDFADLVPKIMRRIACVIIFIEEQFGIEDKVLGDNLGTAYAFLKKMLLAQKCRLLYSVSKPYKVLTNLYIPLENNTFYLDDADKFKLPSEDIKYFFVHFQDPINATRVKSLRKHDKIMKEVFRKVKEVIKGPIGCFYTGKRNHNKIEFFCKKHIKGGKSDTIRSKMSLIRVSGMYSATQQCSFDRMTQKPFAVEERSPKNRYSTIIDYTDFQLRFNFSFTRSQWALDTIELIESNQTVGKRSMNIRVGWGWSYVCASPLVILNTRDGSSLIIPKYQFQAFRSLRDGDEGGAVGPDTQFDKAILCEPYFNCPILAGLFVSFILLSIFATGLMCIMDIKTNDRYDDPNGKDIMTKADLVEG